MITHVTQSEFIDTFRNSHSYKNNFSYDGLMALFEYLEQYEDSTDEQIQFDMIGLCCDYTEYSNIEEFINDYGDSLELHENLDYSEIISVLRDHTEVIEFEGRVFPSRATKSFIIRAF
mgnify:CR=1 FL=1